MLKLDLKGFPEDIRKNMKRFESDVRNKINKIRNVFRNRETANLDMAESQDKSGKNVELVNYILVAEGSGVYTMMVSGESVLANVLAVCWVPAKKKVTIKLSKVKILEIVKL